MLNKILFIICLIGIAGISGFIGYSLKPEAQPTTTITISSNYSYYPHSIDPNKIHLTRTNNQTTITYDGLLYDDSPSCATPSMYPSIGCGNMVIVEMLNPNDIVNIGDVVVFNRNGDITNRTMHQIIDQNSSCYITKGQNNDDTDQICVLREHITERRVLQFDSYEVK